VLSETLKGFSGKLGERWFEILFTPALLFWAGGALLWFLGHQLRPILAWFEERSDSEQIALIVIGLAVITASGAVMTQFALPALKLLEGYWPHWVDPLRNRLARRWEAGAAVMRGQIQALAGLGLENLTPNQQTEFNRLDYCLHYIPVDFSRIMPTRLGNLLRSAEDRPAVRYGLDAAKCWPQLWLCLPDPVKNDIAAARTDLDSAVTALLWSLLFVLWSFFSLWAIPIAILSGALSYFRLTVRAETYADLVSAAFDVHRATLYSTLRLPMPATAADERDAGQILTEYLWRGSDSPKTTFTEAQAIRS